MPQAQFIRTFVLPLLASRGPAASASTVSSWHGGMGSSRSPSTGWSGPCVVSALRTLVWSRCPPGWRARAAGAVPRCTRREAAGIPSAHASSSRHALERLTADSRSAWPQTDATIGLVRLHGIRSVLFGGGVQAEGGLRPVGDRGPAVLSVSSTWAATRGTSAHWPHARRGRGGAIDSDPVVVGETWRRATADRLPILPLVVDLARPSPGVGWRNGECPGFLDRAHGGFDLVLMLAVIHHMLVTERVPLDAIVEVVAELTTDRIVVEYVGPADPCFRRSRVGVIPCTASCLRRRSRRLRATLPDRALRVCAEESDRRLYLMTRGT